MVLVWCLSLCIRDVTIFLPDSATNKRQNKEPAWKINEENRLLRRSPVAEEGRRLWNEGPPAPTERLGWPPPTVSGRTGCSWMRTSMMRLSSQKKLNWKCRASPGKTQVNDVIKTVREYNAKQNDVQNWLAILNYVFTARQIASWVILAITQFFPVRAWCSKNATSHHGWTKSPFLHYLKNGWAGGFIILPRMKNRLRYSGGLWSSSQPQTIANTTGICSPNFMKECQRHCKGASRADKLHQDQWSRCKWIK